MKSDTRSSFAVFVEIFGSIRRFPFHCAMPNFLTRPFRFFITSLFPSFLSLSLLFSFCPSVCLSVCPSVRLSVCRSFPRRPIESSRNIYIYFFLPKTNCKLKRDKEPQMTERDKNHNSYFPLKSYSKHFGFERSLAEILIDRSLTVSPRKADERDRIDNRLSLYNG